MGVRSQQAVAQTGLSILTKSQFTHCPLGVEMGPDAFSEKTRPGEPRYERKGIRSQPGAQAEVWATACQHMTDCNLDFVES